jgi:hypothetical protein
MVNELISLFVVSCYVVIIVTGIFLFIRMNKTQLNNLFGLAMFFIMFGAQFFLGLFNLLVLYAIISESALIFLLIFVKSTFYKESKILFTVTLIFITILKIASTVLRLLFQFKIPPTSTIPQGQIPFYYLLVWIVAVQIIISQFWVSYAELSTYLRIKKYNIEPWIKRRYQILGISSAFFISNGILLPLLPLENAYDNIFFIVSVAITIFIFSFGNLIGWIMPKWLKNIFNKNYSITLEKDTTEKELIDNLNRELKGRGLNGDN